MAWNIKRNEQSAETERGGREEREGTEEHKFNAATRLAGEKTEKQRQGEREKWGRGLRCSADRPAFKKQRGLSEGQQELGSTVR